MQSRTLSRELALLLLGQISDRGTSASDSSVKALPDGGMDVLLQVVHKTHQGLSLCVRTCRASITAQKAHNNMVCCVLHEQELVANLEEHQGPPLSGRSSQGPLPVLISLNKGRLLMCKRRNLAGNRRVLSNHVRFPVALKSTRFTCTVSSRFRSNSAANL